MAIPPAQPTLVTPQATSAASVDLQAPMEAPSAMTPGADAPPAATEPRVPTKDAQVTAEAPPAAPARTTPRPPKPAMPPKPAPVVAKPPPSADGRIAGRLDLVAAGREGIVAGEVAEGLVYFLPKSGGEPPKPGTFTVDTRSKGFLPSVLVVPVGSTVRFPNRDSILHNVFSRTPGSSFDFGYYGPGETRQRVFSKPGLVLVNCNVHHNMRLDVVVLSTPYYTRPDRSGRYALDGLPKGPGTLVFWHPRADAQQVAVTLPLDAAVSRRLAATKPSRHVGTEH